MNSIPTRFSPVQILRDDFQVKTLIANDLLLERENVIVKIVRKDCVRLDSTDLIQRFSWLRGLQHNQFAKVFDFGLTQQGHLYLVREFLTGSDALAANASAVMRTLVSAVEFLSQHSCVHGAIKLSNIFFTENIVKVTDPSFVNLVAYNDKDYLHFIAPEVLRGGQPTHEADLYSLGAVLYKILTGRNVFEDSDVDRLRCKYLSASRQLAPYLLPISPSISEPLLALLARNPADRLRGFQALKSVMECEITVAEGAPFVGRQAQLERAIQILDRPPSSLRAILVEGETGSGKSRFVNEMRIQSGVRGFTFVSSQCSSKSAYLEPIKQVLYKLVNCVGPAKRRRRDVGLERFKPNLAEFLRTSLASLTNGGEHSRERVINDCIGLLSSLTRLSPIVMAIEDLNHIDAMTVRFIRGIAMRASELPFTLFMTHRPGETEVKWLRIFECLNVDYLTLKLTPLTDSESRTLVHFLEPDPDRCLSVMQLSSGNPLFLETYARCLDPVPAILASASDSMLASLTDNTRTVLRIMSVFQGPVALDIVAKLCDLDTVACEAVINKALRVGLISRHGPGIAIRFRAIQLRLYSSLSKEERRGLNRAALFALRDVEADVLLAHYAFEANEFTEAGERYRKLASCAYEAHDFRIALKYYECLRQCCEFSGGNLTVSERINLAGCLNKVRTQSDSDQIYRELLTCDDLTSDPESLSTIYIRLATTINSIPTTERERYLGLAINCLPRDSSHLSRLKAICEAFVKIGSFHRADEVFERMEQYLSRDGKDLSQLNTSRASILLSKGEFRSAMNCYLAANENAIQAQLANNLAFCAEQLGDLKRALHYQSYAKGLAVATGNLVAEIMSINNLAAIHTKCGELRQAERLFDQARTSVRALTGGTGLDRRYVTFVVEADTAIHCMYKGDYALALECVGKIRASAEFPSQLGWVFGELIRCRVFAAIGATIKAHKVLSSLDECETARTPFFQVERVLIEEHLPEMPIQLTATRLQHALAVSERMGTLYQTCEALISLGSIHLKLNQRLIAQRYLADACELVSKQGYRLLAAHALLLTGLCSETRRDKLLVLIDAFQAASEMGLQELVAESAYHIGITNLEASNTVTAREYLIRSTSITARLAEGVPGYARSRYMAKEWRRDALRALERCNESIPLYPEAFSAEGEKYFTAAYRFTMAAATANSVEGLGRSIEQMLATSFTRAAVVVLKCGLQSHSIPVRMKVSPELLQRVEGIQGHSRNRVSFESTDDKGKHAYAWIPLSSETCRGGIYVATRSHESPFTEKEMELLTMMGTIGSSALKRIETRQVQELLPRELSEFHGIIGASKPIKEVYSQIQMAATNVATVLLEGESGTGKELVAKAIHTAGPRAKQPFITVDCGAIPETLIEAELFGARKGSYTGAVADRPGLFESAHRGTLFLDEISNTTPTLQAKLLRVIQEREVRRIGETKGRTIDVRLIVASNQSLAALADAGQFRKDLLYRLNVLHIKLPPLRTRRDDIPMLAHAFLRKLNTSNNTKKCFGPDVIEQLMMHDFPGNVRELQNAIERAFFSATGIVITDIPLEEHAAAGTDLVDDVQLWFKEISEGRKDFWSAIQNRYRRRDISREKVLAFVDFGLRSTGGSYKTLASKFGLQEKDYHRFMDFLRRHDCLLDFRPYRKASTDTRED